MNGQMPNVNVKILNTYRFENCTVSKCNEYDKCNILFDEQPTLLYGSLKQSRVYTVSRKIPTCIYQNPWEYNCLTSLSCRIYHHKPAWNRQNWQNGLQNLLSEQQIYWCETISCRSVMSTDQSAITISIIKKIYSQPSCQKITVPKISAEQDE